MTWPRGWTRSARARPRMVGAPDVVQPRAARDKRGVPLAREHRGWREAPRMCRSRRIGIRGRALGALAAVLVGCGGQTAKPTPTPQARLVVVGDSLTAGRYADTP